MNAIQQKIAQNQLQLVRQKNLYSQASDKREKVFTKHADGNYYSDCSSSVRHITERADPATAPLGGNTVTQYLNKRGKVVDCKIVAGVPTDIGKLQVGDCFYFAGTDSTRAAADYVGHVEQVHSITGGKVMLYGHGSGNPRLTEMVAYCKIRQATKTSTRKGNRGLLKVVRFIQHDGGVASPVPDTAVEQMLGDRVLRHGMTGDDVKQLQRALRDLGFFGGTIGGNYLDITLGSVRSFQKKHKLNVDGEYGAKSHAALMALLSPAPAPVKPQAKGQIITTGNVSLRVGPGTEFADAATVKTGTALAVLIDGDKHVSACGWYAVVVDKTVLWVSGKYTKLA